MKKRSGKKSGKQVIAHRRKCKVKGTGLSHYVMTDKKTS